jgi:hypothetical protein
MDTIIIIIEIILGISIIMATQITKVNYYYSKKKKKKSYSNKFIKFFLYFLLNYILIF